MAPWLAVILEILKFTIPALIVFFTVYYLVTSYLEKQYQIEAAKLRQGRQKTTLPVRLQAYERLALLCERISIPNLLLRLRAENSSAAALRVAMLLAIQQEFEHNTSQQIYVSENLWKIIQLARKETEDIINGMAERMEKKSNPEELGNMLLAYLSQQETSALLTAQSAIKKEAGLLF
jgi:hypothetical protein